MECGAGGEERGIPPGAYFLTDEKVCKESPRNFRMFLGLFRRPKREVDKAIARSNISATSPLGIPLAGRGSPVFVSSRAE